MKAEVWIASLPTLVVVGREKGDENPSLAVDLTPELINRWQRAKLELDLIEVEIAKAARKAGVL